MCADGIVLVYVQDVPSSSGDDEKQILHGSIRHTQSAG